jgi:hypothetical protein
VDAFAGCLSPLVTFSVQSLNFIQEVFCVFQRETDAAGVCTILSYRWWAGARHLGVSLPLGREQFDKMVVQAKKIFLKILFVEMIFCGGH